MLESKVALVTGASRGIGQAIALELGRQGAVVVGTATTQQGADNISAMLTDAGISGAGRVLDVADPASIEALLADVRDNFGPPAVLVNNAGITRDNLLMRMKDEEWSDIIRTNLDSVYRMSKACLRGMMKAREGRIINISSVVALSGNAGQANYAAAKAGIIGFSRSLAREVGSRGITVNVVAPGFVETDMTNALDESQREAMLANVALQRLAQPEEIARAVAFLAGEGGSYITGETLNVNGGLHMA